MTAKKSRKGRPRHYDQLATAGTLHLPPTIWAVFDEIGGSRTSAFLKLANSEFHLRRLRRAIEKSRAS